MENELKLLLQRILITIFLSGSFLIAAEPWTKPEIATEVIYQALIIIDWKQTSEFHRHKTYVPYVTTNGKYYYDSPLQETNILMPPYPKQRTINTVFLAGAVGHALITNYLYHDQRIFWQTATIGLQVLYINRNYELGVRIKW